MDILWLIPQCQTRSLLVVTSGLHGFGLLQYNQQMPALHLELLAVFFGRVLDCVFFHSLLIPHDRQEPSFTSASFFLIVIAIIWYSDWLLMNLICIIFSYRFIHVCPGMPIKRLKALHVHTLLLVCRTRSRAATSTYSSFALGYLSCCFSHYLIGFVVYSYCWPHKKRNLMPNHCVEFQPEGINAAVWKCYCRVTLKHRVWQT